MSNSELSKLKILFMYDFFRTQVNAFDDGSSVSVNDIIGYLEEKTGYTFERKSIYADISKLNEYISITNHVKGADSWITSEGRKYKRNELEDEITIDEARLIVDAISTTNFVDTELCSKIAMMFPTYFSGQNNRRALYPHYEKINTKRMSWLNLIRGSIEEENALKISYGYQLGSELTETSDKYVSPMVLDWDNNCYYLIAIDNNEAKNLERDQSLTKALRRYRLDRIAQVSIIGKDSFIGYKNNRLKEQELKSFIENSLSAFSGDKVINVELVIKGKTRKDVLKAYGALASRVHHNISIHDDTKLDKGILKISLKTGHAPTLYTDLFELSTFEGVDVDINNDEVCRNYSEFIKKAAASAKLQSL